MIYALFTATPVGEQIIQTLNEHCNQVGAILVAAEELIEFEKAKYLSVQRQEVEQMGFALKTAIADLERTISAFDGITNTYSAMSEDEMNETLAAIRKISNFDTNELAVAAQKYVLEQEDAEDDSDSSEVIAEA